MMNHSDQQHGFVSSTVDSHPPVIVAPHQRIQHHHQFPVDLPTPDVSPFQCYATHYFAHSEVNQQQDQQQQQQQQQQHNVHYYNGFPSPIDMHLWPASWPFPEIPPNESHSLPVGFYQAPVNFDGQFGNKLAPISHFGMRTNTLNQNNGIQYQVARPNDNPKRGGRRPKEFEDFTHDQMSVEERDKRDKRRQRNKEAAARCRQRRLDQMQLYQDEVDQLKEENCRKEATIRQLKAERDELEQLINGHDCKCSNIHEIQHLNNNNNNNNRNIGGGSSRKRQHFASTISSANTGSLLKLPKMEPTLTQVTIIRDDNTSLRRPNSLTFNDNDDGGNQTTTNSNNNNNNNNNGMNTRCWDELMTLVGDDCSLLNSKDHNNWSGNNVANSAGVPISTPSAGLNVDVSGGEFVSMQLLNQQTGLTPISAIAFTSVVGQALDSTAEMMLKSL